LELARVIQTFPGLESHEIPQTIASLKELIVRTLELRILFPIKQGRINAPGPYDDFASLLKRLQREAFPAHTVSVMTFNYDIALDVALTRIDLGPDYVLAKHDKRPSPVQLMKLHGSLNWGLEKRGASDKPPKIIPLHLYDFMSQFTVMEDGMAPVEIGSKLAEWMRQLYSVDVEAEPVIVPPSWNKSDYHQTLSDVWAAAAKHLSEAEHIFIIGYSLPLTDSFFRHLFALGSVGKSPLRQFAVYDTEPSGGAVDVRFQQMLGPGSMARYQYHSMTFARAIGEIKNMFPARG
jgi:hypothetical protein